MNTLPVFIGTMKYDAHDILVKESLGTHDP